MKKEQLYIPTKILDSDDYITGIGAKEVYIILIVSALSAVLGVMLNQITGDTFSSVLVSVALIVITVFLVRRDLCNENVFQKVKILQKYSRSQKKFKYQYKNIYEDILYEEAK